VAVARSCPACAEEPVARVALGVRNSMRGSRLRDIALSVRKSSGLSRSRPVGRVAERVMRLKSDGMNAHSRAVGRDSSPSLRRAIDRLQAARALAAVPERCRLTALALKLFARIVGAGRSWAKGTIRARATSGKSRTGGSPCCFC
jgi:hypothetical protein